MLLTALFSIAKNESNQNACKLIKWINEVWNILKMEYYSGIKNDESVTTAWNLENLMLSERKKNLKDHVLYGSWEGNGTPLQYSCLENPMDVGAWWAAVQGVTKSWTPLNAFPFTFHFHGLEKEMATHSSVLVWRIPGTGEPGGLPSMGSHRVGHDWSDLAVAVYGSIHMKY